MSGPSKSERIGLWLERLNRFSQSPLTVAEFCQQEQVSLPSFYQWKRRLSPRIPSRKRIRRPAPTERLKTPNQRSGFTELIVSQSPTASARALLPGGITIHLGEHPETIELIVDRLLKSAGCGTGPMPC